MIHRPIRFGVLALFAVVGVCSACGQNEPAPKPAQPAAPAPQPAAPPPAPAATPSAPAPGAEAASNSRTHAYGGGFAGIMKVPLIPRAADGSKPPVFPLNLYDPLADGQTMINAACAQARGEGKRVVVFFGENYCHFCAWLHDTIVEDARLKPYFDREFITVWVDLGQGFGNAKHMALATQLGATIGGPNGTGAPVMVVIDPKSCTTTRVLPSKDVLAKPMTVSFVFDPNGIYEWFTRNITPVPTAESLVAAANQRAAKEKKRVFAYFRSQTDPRSMAFDRVITSPQVAEILDREMVVQPLDAEQAPGARQQLELWSGSGMTPLPWFIVTEASGRMVVDATSRSLGKGVALPATDEEAAALAEKLKKAGKAMTDEDVAAIVAALRAAVPAQAK